MEMILRAIGGPGGAGDEDPGGDIASDGEQDHSVVDSADHPHWRSTAGQAFPAYAERRCSRGATPALVQNSKRSNCRSTSNSVPKRFRRSQRSAFLLRIANEIRGIWLSAGVAGFRSHRAVD